MSSTDQRWAALRLVEITRGRKIKAWLDDRRGPPVRGGRGDGDERQGSGDAVGEELDDAAVVIAEIGCMGVTVFAAVKAFVEVRRNGEQCEREHQAGEEPREHARKNAGGRQGWAGRAHGRLMYNKRVKVRRPAKSRAVSFPLAGDFQGARVEEGPVGAGAFDAGEDGGAGLNGAEHLGADLQGGRAGWHHAEDGGVVELQGAAGGVDGDDAAFDRVAAHIIGARVAVARIGFRELGGGRQGDEAGGDEGGGGS